MFAHCFADIFFWFSGIKAFWPVGFFGLPDSINIWAGLNVPGLVTNILGAMDYLAAALYLLFLTKGAKRPGWLRGMLLVQWPLFVLFLALAFFLEKGLFDLVHYAVFILFLLPAPLYATVKMRSAIEELALEERGQAQETSGPSA